MVLAGLLGGLMGLGVVLVVDGLRPRRPPPRPARDRRRPPARALVALVVAALAVALTGWPVAGAAGAGVAWWLPVIAGARRGGEQRAARSEAVAAWAEMLRDLLRANQSVEGAIAASVPLAPGPIAEPVARLAERVHRDPEPALVAFATAVADPVADLVVLALRQAIRGAAGGVGELLGTLAGMARERAAMEMRVERSRRRTRTSVRLILGATLATAVAFVVANPAHFAPYDSAGGQVVLALVVTTALACLAWLARLGRLVEPERLLAPDPEGAG